MFLELERFLVVIQEGSVTKAAQKLFITQPALSQAIERLEKEVRGKLFQRIGKRLVLTKDGETVARMGEHIIRLWGTIKDPTARGAHSSPLFSIGLFDNAALKLSSYFQKQLLKKQLPFEVTIDRSSILYQGMQQGVYDMCICVLNPTRTIGSHVLLFKTFSEVLYPVSGKKWKENAEKIPFILYNQGSDTRQYIDKIFFENGIKPSVIVESTSPAFMKELAIGKSGVALLPKNFIQRELQQEKLFIQKFPFTFAREIGLFLNKESNIKTSDIVVQEIIKNL